MHDADHHHPEPAPVREPRTAASPLGHNAPPREPVPWQLPDPPRAEPGRSPAAPEPDFDLVEAAFAEGIRTASDPTSFLRLSGVPFRARDASGRRLRLLRVELEEKLDVGKLSPLLGGGGFRYDPLPARLVSRRRTVALVYASGAHTLRLGLGEARALRPDSDPEDIA
ncbi:MAG: hypothetical protein RMK73_08945 [Geminicoccaceae bacterium]|nr:hypothetical protein [Geminicoccaceae bacterium]MDW8123809.1 hypothetical protein [Geminicoccaceae bacterium]MDW8341593.1 hypothetical protein [Geminicoccaceae bacterium]